MVSGMNGPANKTAAGRELSTQEAENVNNDGNDTVICQWCDGGGEANNPLNADPAVALTDWHPPVICPRCIGTGRDPDGTPHRAVDLRAVVESIGDTCCGRCPGGTCYVDQVTGA